MAIVYLSAVFFIYFLSLISSNDHRRKAIVIVSSLISVFMIFFNQFYLNGLSMNFQPSDPQLYFDLSKLAISYSELFNSVDDKSNMYYYFVNKMFIDWFGDEFYISVFLNLSNTMFFFGCYLFSLRRFGFTNVEYVILLHPYLFLTAIRNVRDLQIIGLSLIIISCIYESRFYLKYYAVLLLMLMARPLFFFIFVFAHVYKTNIKYLTRKSFVCAVAFVVFLVSFLFLYFDGFYLFVTERMVAAIGFYNGYDSDEYDLWMDALSSFNSASVFYWKVLYLFVASVVKFIFTPSLFGYMNRYSEAGFPSVFNDIYTALDMYLIFAGVAFNVFLFYPVFIKLFFDLLHKKTVVNFIQIISLAIVVAYSFAHLGGTDIRIRYTFIVVFLLSFVFWKDYSYQLDRRYVALSVVLFLILPLIFI